MLMHYQLIKNVLPLNLIRFLFKNRETITIYPYRAAATNSVKSLNSIFSFGHKKYLFGKKNLFIMASCGSCCDSSFSKEALKKKLTSIQYQVTQENDTERAFSGKYCNHFEKGIYTCVVCSQEIFSSEMKYESKCGWPAFFDVVDSKNVKLKNDLSHDMKRVEVSCSKCGAHLGHLFDDGPKPTGKRYCINSASLDFRKVEDTADGATS